MEIISQIEEGMKQTECPYILLENRREAIQYALDNAGEDDILVIAGKGAEDYQDIGGVKRPFNDADTVREILAQREN